jgi:adenine-specific DNA-methyltransferase
VKIPIEVDDAQLVWPAKLTEDGNLHTVPRFNLPFQVIERVNEGRATIDARLSGGLQKTLFDIWAGDEGQTFDSGWRNKLIWGENLYVLSSLMERYAGKIKLIYIDPPFATGTDMNVTVELKSGDELAKKPTAIEEKAYRDTFGSIASYLQTMYDRLVLMKDLLAPDGVIFVHMDWHVGDYVKVIMDEVFGRNNFRNEIIVKRGRKKGLMYQFEKVDRMHVGNDVILWYSKSADTQFKHPVSQTEGVEAKWMGFWSNVNRPTMRYPLLGYTPTRGQWKWEPVRAKKAVENYRVYEEKYADKMPLEEYWHQTGEELEFIRRRPGVKYAEYWVAPRENKILDNVWTDIEAYNYTTGFPTEKHEELLSRIITQFSGEGDLVADFFSGSGTTLAVAEKNKRRWIGCDLSRFAIHITRKRLLDIENCKPFEVLNLGKYERQIWQDLSFSGKDKETVIYEYLAFIMKAYKAEPLAGFGHIHGRKRKALIHVGAVDAPVTIDEVNAALAECVSAHQSELHILGWEWEMGMHDLVEADAKRQGVDLRLVQIPNEVMDPEMMKEGQVKFFDLAYVQARVQRHGMGITIELQEFVIPSTDLIPEDQRKLIKHWSDMIDYWAVDFDFKNDTFLNNWQAYRTRDRPKLELKSMPYEYKKHGKYKVLVKVVDLFGIDSSKLLEIEV